ncbi:MAG TPA: TIGR03943 family protein [Firmicutes bacterium]|nr:TIGR03943 family protein [Bacillota bacterium]
MKNLHAIFNTFILFCYAFLLFLLLRTGAIKMLINPRFSFLSTFALIIFLIMFFYSFRKFGKKTRSSDGCHYCKHEKKTATFQLSDTLLILPLLLLFTIPPEVLIYQPPTVLYVTTRARNTSNSTKNFPYTSIPQTVNVDRQKISAGYIEYTQVDIGNALFYKRQALIDKLTHSKVFLRGMIQTFSQLKPGETVLYRFVITCCAADGVPVGILVKLPRNTSYHEGDWIGVEGTIQLLPFNDKLKTIDPLTYLVVTPEKAFPYFTATKAYKITTPTNQYLYP